MAILKRAKSSISGLVDDLSSLGQSILNEATTREDQIGDLSLLDTSDKLNLVDAVNEVNNIANSAASTAGEALELVTDSAKKAANLSDLASIEVARENLDVWSISETELAISEAKLALGSNYTVENIAQRDALTGLTTLDRVFVKDDGDGKWATYQVGAVTEEGVVTEWVKIADQDSLENAISAPAILAALLSNPDVNVLTDAELAKVQTFEPQDFLDKDNLVQELNPESSATIPSCSAVAAYVDAELAERAGGIAIASETLVVSGNDIELLNAPIGGAAGVLNFGTVRYIDGDGIAYDAPVVSLGGAGNAFSISTDVAEQWNGFSVRIQYAYNPA